MRNKSINFLQLILTVLFLMIACTISVLTQTLSFEQHPIDLSFPGIHAIKVLDMDDDGDLDIVAGSEQTPTTASIGLHWLRNDGGNPINWTRIPIDPSFVHIMSVDVGYINDDNYPDVVATSWSLHQAAWWKNSGDPTQGWAKQIIRSNFTNAHDAKCADIDEDGDVDIISASKTLGSIIISLNDGGTTINWQTSPLTNSFAGALTVLVTDLDEDDDLDILGIASDAGGEIAWWSNLGGTPLTWEENTIAANFPGGSNLFVIDLNDDDLNDVVANAWMSNQVAYWLCNDIQNNSWTKYTVAALDTPANVSAGDLDEDGDIDIVAVGKIPGELVIYGNTNFNWLKTTLTDDFYGGTPLEVLDFDGDTDLDIIAGASYLGELYWFENKLVSSVNENQIASIPRQFNLYQNYPNPFNPSTKITFQIPELSFVSLKVYDALGNGVAVLVDEELSNGTYEIEFEAVDLPSGIYFYKFQSGNFSITKKLVLLR